MIGQCLTQLDQIPQAIKAYKKAVKLNPNDAAALSDLGMLYSRKGENLDICLTFCRQSVLIAPQNPLFHCRLAELYQEHDQWDQALTEYEKAAVLGHDVQNQVKVLRSRMAADQNENYALRLIFGTQSL